MCSWKTQSNGCHRIECFRRIGNSGKQIINNYTLYQHILKCFSVFYFYGCEKLLIKWSIANNIENNSAMAAPCWKQEPGLHPGLPCEKQGPRYLSHHCFLSGTILTGSWITSTRAGSPTTHAGTPSNILTALPNAYPSLCQY